MCVFNHIKHLTRFQNLSKLNVFLSIILIWRYIHNCRDIKFPTMWYMRPATLEIKLRVCAGLCQSFEYYMDVKLLTEFHLEFLSLKIGCKGLYESTHVRMSHCWRSNVAVHIYCIKSLTRTYGNYKLQTNLCNCE